MLGIPRSAIRRWRLVAVRSRRAVRRKLAGLRALVEDYPLRTRVDPLRSRCATLIAQAHSFFRALSTRARSQSLQTHIVALFLLMMAVVQLGGFALINTV